MYETTRRNNTVFGILARAMLGQQRPVGKGRLHNPVNKRSLTEPDIKRAQAIAKFANKQTQNDACPERSTHVSARKETANEHL